MPLWCVELEPDSAGSLWPSRTTSTPLPPPPRTGRRQPARATPSSRASCGTAARKRRTSGSTCPRCASAAPSSVQRSAQHSALRRGSAAPSLLSGCASGATSAATGSCRARTRRRRRAIAEASSFHRGRARLLWQPARQRTGSRPPALHVPALLPPPRAQSSSHILPPHL